jgi:hypothetical protein
MKTFTKLNDLYHSSRWLGVVESLLSVVQGIMGCTAHRTVGYSDDLKLSSLFLPAVLTYP